ncbi:amidohydrolase family protein [Austwickia chelonae]|uniref:amidohydrolase family protein n=1 Tax=Austwickia chelonae TaxID=100225 RepID=UPI000E2773A0|nr:amidohydrolase family protein [Austwickia chelonae]
MSAPVLHVSGQIHVSADEVRDDIWVVDGCISYTPPNSAADVETVHGHVYPGMVDAHCHIGLEKHGAVDPHRAEAHALAERDAGVLLIRDAGSPADTRWLQKREDLPRIIRAGRHIARTRRYIPNFAHEIEPDLLVDYVRQEARAGDGWVKLVGDWIDRERGDLGICWPVEVLTQAVTAAHEEGARVTAHCFGEQSLVDFAAAGVDCIEHATGLVPETIDTFATQKIAIVPTLVNILNFPDFAAAGRPRFPSYAAHMLDLHRRRYETISAAHEAGVSIYCGTDAGGQIPHGLLAHEVLELSRTRMGVEGALAAATWEARQWLGRPGLEEGAEADFLVFLDDPRTDLRILGRPHRTVLRGRLVR